MSSLVNWLQSQHGVGIYLVVGLLVFVEDALFVGFVVPGETAALLGGVAANGGKVSFPAMLAVVVVAAILGDSVGYEVGRVVGPRLLTIKLVSRHSARLEAAQQLLAARGGWAVFAGRFVAFFRAVMPALAGMSGMRYRRFLPWNVAGGLAWGTLYVTIGYVAGSAYQRVAARAGEAAAGVIALLVIVAVVVWRVRKARAERAAEEEAARAGAPPDTSPDTIPGRAAGTDQSTDDGGPVADQATTPTEAT